MKQRNPSWGCPRIAQQIALAFQIQIDKDVVRRILAHHHRPGQDFGGPSWLTFLGHMKDSLWSMDLFRCESATLRTHRSEEHTSELQSRLHLVCRLLLEKKKNRYTSIHNQ